MSAINTMGFGDGFQQGFGFAQNVRDRRDAKQARQQAIETDNARYQDQQQYRQQQQQFQHDQAIATAGYRDDALAETSRHNKAQEKLAAERNAQGAWQARKLQDEKLKEQGISYLSAGQYNQEIEQKLSKSGFDHLTMGFYLNKEKVADTEKLGQMTSAIMESGNLANFNNKEFLDQYNKVYAPTIKRGIGEQAHGSVITNKRVEGFEPGPEGKAVVIKVGVQLENGGHYIENITLNRSASPQDPVKLVPVQDLLNDVMGRSQMAHQLRQPENLQRLQSAVQRISGGNTDKLPANAQNIKYLVGLGYSQEDAVGMVYQAKTNPQKAAISLMGHILKGNDTAMEQLTPDQAFQKAQQLVAQMSGTAVGGGAQSNPAVDAIYQKLRANPKNKTVNDERLRQAAAAIAAKQGNQ